MAERAELQGDDPIDLFRKWFAEAEKSEPNDPNAAALATASADGAPSVRMVLVKDVGERAFTFFTNAESQKGRELEANPRAALCFHWKSLRRQVRAEGSILPMPPQGVDKYFHSRSRKSQIGAAVSAQSRPLPKREVLEEEVKHFTDEHPEGEIPRPDFWRGYMLRAGRIEFWMDGPDRLHDRFVFTFNEPAPEAAAGTWCKTRLYP